MKPGQRKRAEALSSQAFALAATKRAAFLDEACADDTALRQEVDRLLAASQQTQTILTRGLESRGGDDDGEAPQLPPEGKSFGRYKILSCIGRGGMGEVWMARDTSLDRNVALKLLRPQLTRNEDGLHLFMREAKAASALNHPNIITIHEFGQADDLHYIATEFIEGVTLRTVLAERRLALSEILSLMKQITAALDSAHRAGIVHRDIKPENIMVRPDGLVKVLDFGLAQVMPRKRETLHDGTVGGAPAGGKGRLMGTVTYMSPEQAQGLTVDERSDIFSLGIVLYELVVGRRPFEGSTMTEGITAILNSTPSPLSESREDVPGELERIVIQALQKEPGRRFASVREMGDALNRVAMLISPTTEIQPAGLHPRRARTLWISMSLAALGLVGFGLYKTAGSSGLGTPEARFLPLIGLPGTKNYAAFSPDGSRIAFAWDGGLDAQVSPKDIYVKAIGGGDPQRLTTAPEDEIFPTWTPDGKYITFQRVFPDRQDVMRIPASGGTEEKIGTTRGGSSWSPDGKILAVSNPNGSEPSGILLLQAGTGKTTRLTTAPGSNIDQDPVFSPDGKWVAFQREVGITERDIHVVPSAGGPSRQVTFDKSRVYGLAWTPGSKELVFAAQRKTVRGIWRVAVTGGPLQRVPVAGQNPSYPSISRQGDRLAWSEGLADTNIWAADGPGFNGHPPGKFKPYSSFIAYPREDHSPEFSPDGRKIVFASGRSGGEDLWIVDQDGHNLVQLTTGGGPTGSPHWSPDGRWIAFDSHINGDADIYVIAANGGPWRRLTALPSSETQPSWSRDGRFIYFKSNRTGRGEYYRVNAEGGTPVKVTTGGAFEAFESPDGKLLYFTKGRGVYGIWAVPVEGGKEVLVPELAKAGYWRSWGVMKEGIYFVSKEAAPRQTVRFFSFATRQITPLLTVDREALWWQAGLAISPDGRRLLYSQLDHSVDEIMLMENFR